MFLWNDSDIFQQDDFSEIKLLLWTSDVIFKIKFFFRFKKVNQISVFFMRKKKALGSLLLTFQILNAYIF